MGAFDATCPKCRRRFGWGGELIDKPPCPNCGHQSDPESLRAAQDEMDRMIEEAEREEQEKWDNRTPEQTDAFERGKAAFRPDVKRIEVNRLNPHSTRVADIIDPLCEWWMRGWNNAEGEHYRNQADGS